MNKINFRHFRALTASVGGWRWAILGTLAVVAAMFPTAAVATPSEGIVSSTVFARGSFADLTNVRFAITPDASTPCLVDILRARYAKETVVAQTVIAPGGNSGWHSHPGPTLVVVQAGELSFYDGEDPTCTVRTYSAGQVFVDSARKVHIARNQGSVNLEIWATYFDVPPVNPNIVGSGAFRIDAPAPGNCSF